MLKVMSSALQAPSQGDRRRCFRSFRTHDATSGDSQHMLPASHTHTPLPITEEGDEAGDAAVDDKVKSVSRTVLPSR